MQMVYLLLLFTFMLPDAKPKQKLIYSDLFNKGMDNWIVEQAPGGTTKIIEGYLEIDDSEGCTVWFKHKLEGDIKITCEVMLVNENGKNDRVSDLNFFWMATDPTCSDSLFFAKNNRNGKFAQYHSLKLYYVGYGANNNTTTRFRRYPGDGTRPMLPGYDLSDSRYMNIANRLRKIEITSIDGVQTFSVDGELIFQFADEHPFTSGWFAFRTVNNHMKISNFNVFQIKR